MTVTLNGKTYIAYDLAQSEYSFCYLVIEQNTESYFVLKCCTVADHIDAWRKAFYYENEFFFCSNFSPERLASFRKNGICFPLTYGYFENITVNCGLWEQRTYPVGILIEYVSGESIHCLGGDIISAAASVSRTLSITNSLGIYNLDLKQRDIIRDRSGYYWVIDFTGSYIMTHNDSVLVTALNNPPCDADECEKQQIRIIQLMLRDADIAETDVMGIANIDTLKALYEYLSALC